MTDIVTVNPDDLAERTTATADLFALVCSSGGPVQRLAFDKLLAKLIATNLCKDTEALLQADLAHDADAVALVSNDPTALLNGWWRKTGVSGAGNWVQFEELSRAVRLAAEDAAALAEDWADVAAAEAQVSRSLTDGFDDKPLVETYTHGNPIVDTGSTGPSGLLWLEDPLPHSGKIIAIPAFARSNGPTEVHFHDQLPNGKRVFRKKVTFTAVATGAPQNYDVSAQNVYGKRGWWAAWKGGAGVAVAASPPSLYSATAPTDTTEIVPTYLDKNPSFGVTIERDTIVSEGAVKDAIDRIQLPSPPCVRFFSPENNRRIMAAIAKVRKGIPMPFNESLVRIIGDSNQVRAAVGGSEYTGSFDLSYFALLAEQLPLLASDDGHNIPTQRKSSFCGANNPQGTYPDYNPHCISLGDWALDGTTNYLSIGGAMFVSTTVGGAPLEFEIEDGINTIETGYPIDGTLSLGGMECSTDGGATWTPVDQSGAKAYGKITLTPDPGTGRTIQYRHASGTRVAIHRQFGYDSTKATLNFVNGAIPGSRTSTTWMTHANPCSPLSLLRSEPAALTIVGGDSNDISDGVSLETYLARKRTQIYAALAQSDVWALTPPPIQVDGNPNHALDRQVSFYAGLYDLCKELNVTFFDMAADYGTWAQANAKGWMADYIHPAPLGNNRPFYKIHDAFGSLG